MINLIDEAVRALHELPEAAQKAAARAILDYQASYDDDVQLSDEQVAEIERQIADPNRKFVSLTELDKRIRRLGV
jgi:hypothetical protein